MVLAPLVLVVILGVSTTVAFVVARRVGADHGLQGYVGTILIGTIVGEGCFLALFAAWLRRQGQSIGDLGWLHRTRSSAVAIGLLIAVVYAAISLSRQPVVRLHVLDLTPLKLLAIVAALTAGVVEETLCRGFVITRLTAARTSLAVQVGASAVVFALLHATYGPIGILFTFVLGLALAVTYIYGRRSLTPVIASHALIDLVIEPGLLLALGSTYRG